MSEWAEKRILILGMTYPSYSSKYIENACTGGLEEETKAMVRIHPVPHRYLSQPFKKFQWISAKVTQHDKDGRPESLRIEPESIRAEETIHHSEAETRKSLILASPHMVRSVEELHERWKKGRVSLGTIRPKEITGVRIKRKPDAAHELWLQKEREIMSQEPLAFFKRPKPLTFIPVEFKVSWVCDDPRCDGHEMGLLQWGLHELYRKYEGHPEQEQKALESMQRELDMAKRDVFMFLGNFRGKMWNFGLMDTYSPLKPKPVTKKGKKSEQLTLL